MGFAFFLLAFTLASCSCASNADGAAATAGIRTEPIQDPSLGNMTAFNVKIPSKWHFTGVLYQGGNCMPVPNAVFRATSPDGLSYVEDLPDLSWRWGTGPAAAPTPQSTCLPANGPMSGQEFLKYLAGVMKVNYLSADTVPAADAAEAQSEQQNAEASVAPLYASHHMSPPKGTVELARGLVTYKNGTFAMKGRINTKISCTTTIVPGGKVLGPWGGPGHPPQLIDGPSSTVYLCTAHCRYFTAPDSQFAALLKQWDENELGAHQSELAWRQAWMKRSAEQAQQTMTVINNMARQAMQASAQQFAHDQGVRQRMHDQFLATMQRGTDLSMQRATDSMNARSTSASDWVDYALDRRTVIDPNSGQLTKISTQAIAWSNGAGQMYVSKDAIANPNGFLPGNWTQQVYVHGNGTPQ